MTTIKQLISITHDIQSAFDYNTPKDVRAIFLDISKAFDKVWHKGLLYKLNKNGVKRKNVANPRKFSNKPSTTGDN